MAVASQTASCNAQCCQKANYMGLSNYYLHSTTGINRLESCPGEDYLSGGGGTNNV